MNKKQTLINLTIIALSLILILACSFSMTGAWFTDSSSEDIILTVADKVSIELSSASLTDDSNPLPGEVVSFEAVTMSVASNSTSCYARMYFNLTLPELFQSGTVSTTTTGANWVHYNGFYYLVKSSVSTLSAIPTADQLFLLEKDATANFALTNIEITGPDINTEYWGAQMKVKVTAEAAQSAYYSNSATGTWSSANTTAVNWADTSTYNNGEITA